MTKSTFLTPYLSFISSSWRNIKLSMPNKTIYFRKNHKLLISSIVLQNKLHYYYKCNSYGDSEDILSTTVIQPNKIIDVITVDKVERGHEVFDSEVCDFLSRLL